MPLDCPDQSQRILGYEWKSMFLRLEMDVVIIQDASSFIRVPVNLILISLYSFYQWMSYTAYICDL